MSKIEMLGQGLFGKTWMSQIAHNVENPNGKTTTRQTVQNWHRHDQLPDWAIDQLKELAAKRKDDIDTILNIVDDHQQVVNEAIEDFLKEQYSRLNPESTIFMKIGVYKNQYQFDAYTVQITLDKPTDLDQGWQRLNFDQSNFLKNLINIRENMAKKLDASFAVPVLQA